MIKKILENSRFVVFIAVLGSLIATLTLLVFGIYEIGVVLVKIPQGAVELKIVVLKFIEIIDTFLLATVFLIISVGLYELFIDSTLDLPEWLDIKTLNDLKAKLIGVVIIVLAVIFLGNTARWSGGTEILYLGGGIAAVIAALTYFLSQKK
jgi:uncharacterized membrane protein YqhA